MMTSITQTLEKKDLVMKLVILRESTMFTFLMGGSSMSSIMLMVTMVVLSWRSSMMERHTITPICTSVSDIKGSSTQKSQRNAKQTTNQIIVKQINSGPHNRPHHKLQKQSNKSPYGLAEVGPTRGCSQNQSHPFYYRMHQHHAKQRLFAPKLHSFSLFIRPQKRSMNSSIGTLHHRLCILLFRRQHKCGHNKLQKSFVTLSQYTDTDIPWQYGAQQMKQQNIKRSHGAAPGPRQWTA